MRRGLVCLGMALCCASVSGQGLTPFSLPWNDATPGITNLQGWQPNEAGADGPVVVTPDGHYAINGRRIRFLGVDIAGVDAFPAAALADGHAARLARFGFNAVRLHHLEAPWDKARVLVDYASGSSRKISPERLDRLQYFVAQLASHGIYTDLNLLVSREFQPSDGLGPEIAQMGWKDQHILGFFNTTALDLHKEYATEVLTVPNPYRGGRPLAQDPAVAFVEIMNENGLLQKWHEGVLDKMPEVYRAQLRDRWNLWLRRQYDTTQSMLTAWGAINQPLGDDLIHNPLFASGTQSWNLEQHNGAAANFTTPTDYNGGPSLKVEVFTPGAASWHIQINQGDISMETGKVYTVSFWAKAIAPTPLSASIQEAHPNWATIGPSLNYTLGADWKQYTFTFQAGNTDPNSRLNFGGFGDRQTTVWLADVHWQPGGALGGLPDGVSLEDGNVPSLAKQGAAPTAGQQLDWVRFCLSMEKDYWNAMYSHLKQTLGYQGIVWGTIIANSPPNAQADLDAMDSHSYWQHPSFPTGRDFNPTVWTVNNISMINDASGGTLGGMARQRVKGKPHNVTEYQHPAPNAYNSESVLLAAAYGALQDWDGIWFFAYSTSTADYTTGWFDHGGDPGKMANNLLAAALFRRGDVAPANNEIVMAFPPATEARLAATRGGAWNIADGAHLGVPASLALVSRLALSIGPDAGGLTTPPGAPQGPRIESDTGELAWDLTQSLKGVVTVNTTRTKAVLGFTAGREFDLGAVHIAPGQTAQDWSAIGITLLDGAAIDDPAGGAAVIVTTGDHANTGMQFTDATRSSVSDKWGYSPALVEAVSGAIDLPVTADRVSVWALSPTGERLGPAAVSDANGKARIQLSSADPTLWYEVRIAPAPAMQMIRPGARSRF